MIQGESVTEFDWFKQVFQAAANEAKERLKAMQKKLEKLNFFSGITLRSIQSGTSLRSNILLRFFRLIKSYIQLETGVKNETVVVVLA